MYYVYVLKSLSKHRYYIGSTENIEKRIKRHNGGRVRSTKAYRPWKFVYVEEYITKTEARKRENFLKRTAKARKELFELIKSHGPIV